LLRIIKSQYTMIPKIIHFCWLSEDAFPEKIQMCIDSWKRVLPEYEIVHWNFKRFPRGTSKWVDQAFDSHKYAFAADYIRLYALYHYGGIYLDSDVEVLKSFDDLLDLPYFMGKEPTPSGIEAAVLGVEKGNSLIKDMLDSYEGKNFILSPGKYDIRPIPFKFRACIESQYSYNPIENKCDFIYDESIINVFPVDFFSPKDCNTLEIHVTERTYCIHHFSGSWLKPTFKESWSSWTGIVKKRILKTLNHKKNVLLLSNSNIDAMYDTCFAAERHSPLFGARMSTKDFMRLLSMKNQWSDMKLVHVKRKDSKYADQINSFYPIARIDDTDIEIHYINCYSLEQAKSVWQKGIDNMSNTGIYPIFASDDSEAIRMFNTLVNGNGLVVTTLNTVSKGVEYIHIENLDLCNEKSKERNRLLLSICRKINWL
jgi:uncharacterized protein (DUF1919 family)